MSESSAKRARQLARRGDQELSRRSRPAIERQEELFAPQIVVEGHSSFSGPLPPPELLGEYEAILPGLAERIVRMTEKEGDHRRATQRGMLRISGAGLASAFIIAMTVIVWGFILIEQGRSPTGMGAVIAALASLLVVYLNRGGKSRKKPKADS